MDIATIFNSAAAALPVVLVVAALFPVTRLELAAFTGRHALPRHVTSPALPLAIARSRGMRLLGAALGLSLPTLVRAITHDSFDTGSALLWGAGGFLLGAFVAAMVPIARVGEPMRAATLVPRRARQYLPRRTLVLPGVTVVVSVLVAMVYALGPRRPDAPPSGTIVGAVALSILATVVMVAGTRWIVRRPQPVPDDEVLAVDEAVRANGLQLVVGTANAIGAFAAAAAMLELSKATEVDLLERILPWIGLATILVALSAWDGEGWRRRRTRVAA